MCALDCLFLCTIQIKQGGYECYHIPTCQVITQPYISVVPATPTIIVTIDPLSKSNGIQNLKITDLHGHLIFDSTEDPALLAGVDDADDKDKDTSLAGVPVPNTTVMTNADDDSDEESNHNSGDANKANDNSSKASVRSTRSHTPVHSTTSEPPQHPLDMEDVMTQNCLSWKPKFLSYIDPKEFLSHHLTTFVRWEAKHTS